MFTGRDASEEPTDYSLLVACFAGGLTAVCILVVGITLTLYRRNHFMQPMKTQTHLVHYEPSEGDSVVSPLQKPPQRREQKNSPNFFESKEHKDQIVSDLPEEDPDVIPSKVERRPDIFEPNYTPKPERIKCPGNSEILDYSSQMSILQGKDTWIYPNGYRERPENLSPVRPNTLPVHRTHDIYTRSLRVQESCI